MSKRNKSINLAEIPEIREIAEKENITMDEVVRKALRSYMGETDESKVDKWIRILTELVESAETEREMKK